MVKIAPKLYRKYVTMNAKGKPILYVQLEKAVYGMMKSALLFYRKLVADLLSLGFTINPYDPCVANKTIDGKQLTICKLSTGKMVVIYTSSTYTYVCNHVNYQLGIPARNEYQYWQTIVLILLYVLHFKTEVFCYVTSKINHIVKPKIARMHRNSFRFLLATL